MAAVDFLFRQGTSPQTHAILSQKHRIFLGDSGDAIGVISSFSRTDSKTINPIRGIGQGDVIAELVPSVTEPTTLDIERTALYSSMIMDVFGYSTNLQGIARALNHHRWPFDIKSEIVISQLAEEDVLAVANDVGTSSLQGAGCDTAAIVTWYEGCWMNNYTIGFTQDGAIVSESIGVTVTRVSNGTAYVGPCTDTGNASSSLIFNARA